MPPGGKTFVMRRAALLALAALCVHQLRYLAGYGDGAGEALAHHGHGYLDAVLPMLVSLAAAAVLGSLLLSALGRAGGARKSSRPPHMSCVSYAATLVVVFLGQEVVEGALVAGHPDGLEGALDHGGWLALPLAGALGGVVYVVSAGIAAVEERLAGLLVVFVASHSGPPRCLGAPRRLDVASLTGLSLAFGFARRPPPSLRLSA